MECGNTNLNETDCNFYLELLKGQKVAAEVTFSLNVFFSCINFYYLFTRILKLENKSFHLLMFCLLQLTQFVLIASGIFAVEASKMGQIYVSVPDSSIDSKKIRNLCIASGAFFVSAWGLANIINCIFSSKYQVLSLKVEHVMTGKLGDFSYFRPKVFFCL